VSQIEAQAAEFRAQLVSLTWQPNEWSDEGEICFEWISSDRHAIVSIEGDGEIGYAMLVAGKFVAGAEVCPPSRLPEDLARYLSGKAGTPA
jgi:hypothetical protein